MLSWCPGCKAKIETGGEDKTSHKPLCPYSNMTMEEAVRIARMVAEGLAATQKLLAIMQQSVNLPHIVCPFCKHLAPVRFRGYNKVEFDFHPRNPAKDPLGLQGHCDNTFAEVPEDALDENGNTAYSIFYALDGPNNLFERT